MCSMCLCVSKKRHTRSKKENLCVALCFKKKSSSPIPLSISLIFYKKRIKNEKFSPLIHPFPLF